MKHINIIVQNKQINIYIYICVCEDGRTFSPTVWPGIEGRCPADAPCASEADTTLAAIVDLVCPQVLHTMPTPKPKGIESRQKATRHALGRKRASENGNGRKDQVSTEAGATQVARSPRRRRSNQHPPTETWRSRLKKPSMARELLQRRLACECNCGR